MASLLDMCHEVLHDIFIKVQPSDLGKLCQSCRAFQSYIKHNKLLWKEVYLKNFDEPQRKVLERPAWEEELKALVSFQKLLESDNVSLKRASIENSCKTAIRLISSAPPNTDESLNIRLLTRLFESPQNSNVFLFSSSLYKLAGSEDQIPAPTEKARQLSAKLHAFYGTSKEALGRTRSRAAHPYARSKIYDLRNYMDENLWGPFDDDGQFETDWEKVEAIMIVIGHNLKRFSEGCNSALSALWQSPFQGASPNSYKPLCRCTAAKQAGGGERVLVTQPDPPLISKDPYGVTGTWRRVVCFLDYNDLYDFNFSDEIPDRVPRPPIDIPEAIRLITMKLEVTHLERPGEDDGKRLPVVHFKGISRSTQTSWDPNANSKLRGTVRLTPFGDVRWTTLSVFHGEARWRSESIQVGGLRSARGVVGTWFDKDYDINGPAGPTAFWKLSDEVERNSEIDDGVDVIFPPQM